jgi:hypothetical protein
MGLGLLHGQPNTYLTREWYSTAEKLAVWIRNELPSFNWNVPMKYTEAVVSALRGQHVPLVTGQNAFKILEILEIHFEWPITMSEFKPASLPTLAMPNKVGVVPPQLKGMTAAEAADSRAIAIEHYERKYVLAIHTNDPELALAILKAAFALVVNLLEGHGEAKQMERNEPLVEWNEFNAAVNEALQRAPVLQNNFRYLSRAEIHQLRSAPSPYTRAEIVRQLSIRLIEISFPRTRRSRGR